MTKQRTPRHFGAVVVVITAVAAVLVGGVPAGAQGSGEANLTEVIRIPNASESVVHEESQSLFYVANDEVFLQSLSGNVASPRRIGLGNSVSLSPNQETLLVATVPLGFSIHNEPSTFSLHDPVTGDLRGTSSGLYLHRRWTSDSKYFYAVPVDGDLPVLIEASTGQAVDLPPVPEEAIDFGFSALPASLPDGGALVIQWRETGIGLRYPTASLVEGNAAAVFECGADYRAFAVVRDRVLCQFRQDPTQPPRRESALASATIGSGEVSDLGEGFVNSGAFNSDYVEIDPGRWLLSRDGASRRQSMTDLNGYDYEADALFTLQGPLLPVSVEAGFVRIRSLGGGLFTRTISHAVISDVGGDEDLDVVETSVLRLDGTVVASDVNALELNGDVLTGLTSDREETTWAAYDISVGAIVSELDGDTSFAWIPSWKRGLTPGNGFVVQGPGGGFEELGFRRTATSTTLPIRIDDPLRVPADGFRQVILENFSGNTLVIKEARTCAAEDANSDPVLQCSSGFERRLIVYRVNADGVRSDGPAEDQILRLYRAVFGRSPDAGGFAFWNEAYRNGTSLEAIAAQFRAAPEFADRYGESPSNAELVDALYLNILNRQGDAEGVAFWLAQLDDGMDVPTLLVSFAESPENVERTNTTQPITPAEAQILRLYQAAFGRAPDASGWSFWTTELTAGDDLASIAAGFADSPEFEGRYGAAPTNLELVDAMYANVLGRPGDQAGVAFWLDRLADDLTVPEMLVAFAQSPENLVRTGTR